MSRVTGLAVLCALLLVACDVAAPVEATTPTAPPLTNATWPAAYSDLAAVQGRRVDLRARVYAAPRPEAEVTRFFAWIDFDNDRLSTAFDLAVAPPGLEIDAYVHVEGAVAGVTRYKDFRGDDVLQPAVRVDRLEVLDRLRVRPTRAAVEPNQALEQSGVRVTFVRVEFAADETRLYFAVTNGHKEPVDAFGTDLTVTQGGVNYTTVVPLTPGLPTLRGRVAPAATEQGVFLFQPLDPNRGELTVIWRGARVAARAAQFQPWVWTVNARGARPPLG